MTAVNLPGVQGSCLRHTGCDDLEIGLLSRALRGAAFGNDAETAAHTE